jgi:hypothetical protein
MKAKSNEIYFIQAQNGLVKIGKSNKPISRLKTLQTGSPIGLKIIKSVPGGMNLEKLIHYYFKKLRKNGEWFRPDYELKGFLDGKRRICITALVDAYKPRGKFRKYCETLERNRLYL